jgi:putative holliday junction resolvase
LSNSYILAFDFGKARVGVAVGNSAVKIAHPVTTLSSRKAHDLIENIKPIVEKWKPMLILIGRPEYSEADIAENEQKKDLLNCIKKFAGRLEHNFHIPIEYMNEAYSSSVASIQLDEQGVYGRDQKYKLDSLAACAILDSYFLKL